MSYFFLCSSFLFINRHYSSIPRIECQARNFRKRIARTHNSDNLFLPLNQIGERTHSTAHIHVQHEMILFLIFFVVDTANEIE